MKVSLDTEKYRLVVFPQVKKWLDTRTYETPLSQLNLLTQYTSCPILVVAQFIGEITGFTPELVKTIETLETFYGYNR